MAAFKLSTGIAYVRGWFGSFAGPSGNLLFSSTPPTLGAGWGGSAAINTTNGTVSFKITVGTAPSSTCVINLPTASTGWVVAASDITAAAGGGPTPVLILQGGSTTTTATLTFWDSAFAPVAPTANDVILCSAFAF